MFHFGVGESLKPEAFLLNWIREVSSKQPLTDWSCQPSKRLIGFGHGEVSAFTKWASPGFSTETECSIKSHFPPSRSPSHLIRGAQSDKCLCTRTASPYVMQHLPTQEQTGRQLNLQCGRLNTVLFKLLSVCNKVLRVFYHSGIFNYDAVRVEDHLWLVHAAGSYFISLRLFSGQQIRSITFFGAGREI